MKKYKSLLSVILCFSILICGFGGFDASASVSSKAVITVDGNAPGREVSDNMFGIFIEDINYACDGGLNANLIRNNSFEQRLAWDLNWDCRMTGWEIKNGSGALRGENPLNENNPSYFHADSECVIKNIGYPDPDETDGIYLRKNTKYDFSFYCRGKGKISYYFGNDSGNSSGSDFNADSDEFVKLSTTFKAAETEYVSLYLTIPEGCDVDYFRLISRDSFGYGDPEWKYTALRSDLVKALKDLNPSFVRFPGGCLAEGAYDWSMAYNWKTTVGEPEQRKQIPNIWGYNQSLEIGFYEYFCLCDYLDAAPVPVVHAGLMCQGRGDWKLDIDSEEFAAHIEDILDLIEYANGGTDTEWGAVRAANGHSEPFNLKYIAIGNENWMEDYWERFDVIYNAVKKAYPDITVISSAGAWADGKEWEYAWEQIDEKYTDTVVDEHYYVAPWWVYGNYEKYDTYDRNSAKVFVGEYAVHRGGGDQITKNNEYVAIDEAVHCTALIRNSDIVEMACYAPLFARQGYTQWAPNLIWYNSEEVVKTPSYYVQQLYMQNTGNVSLKTDVKGEDIYSAATVDTENKLIYVYVVNPSKSSQSAEIDLKGFGDLDSACEIRYIGSGLWNVANNFGFLNDFISPRYSKTVVTGNKIKKSVGPESMNVFCLSYGGENTYRGISSDTGYKAGTQLEIIFFEYLGKFVVWFTATPFYENFIKGLIFKD